jgi:hypothetical protein
MLSDEDLALVLEGKARKLEAGEKDREEVEAELLQLIADSIREVDENLVYEGPLRSQGRASFGRSNEGRAGLAVFLPDD